MAISPDTRAQAVALSEAGFTTATIADRLGISVSSVKRIRQAHGVTKGTASAELVEAARNELAKAFDADYIRSQAAALIIDELALAHELRGRLQAAMATAPAPTDLRGWAIYMRGLTACVASQPHRPRSRTPQTRCIRRSEATTGTATMPYPSWW